MLGRLLEIVVLLLVIRAVWRAAGSMVTVRGGVRQRPADGSREPRAVKLMRDPVCGTYASPSNAIVQDGQYFCSEQCRDTFRRHAS